LFSTCCGMIAHRMSWFAAEYQRARLGVKFFKSPESPSGVLLQVIVFSLLNQLPRVSSSQRNHCPSAWLLADRQRVRRLHSQRRSHSRPRPHDCKRYRAQAQHQHRSPPPLPPPVYSLPNTPFSPPIYLFHSRPSFPAPTGIRSIVLSGCLPPAPCILHPKQFGALSHPRPVQLPQVCRRPAL
jgi:hypothetical protein